MLDKYLEEYIDALYEKQNIGMAKEQQGLFTKKEYYDLLKTVIELVKKYKDYSIEELRSKLYDISGINEKVTEFIYKKGSAPGMVFSYGTNNYRETVIIGNSQEVTMNNQGDIVPKIEKMTENTIFDLASITKIFTSISILKLVSMGLVNLNDEIIKYAPKFKNLAGVTIYDLLTFSTPLITKKRLDNTLSIDEAENILFDIEIDENAITTRPYTDMGAMVLKYVIESASGMEYYDFLYKNILSEIGMMDTHVIVPEEKLKRVASTNFDCKYYKNGEFVISDNPKKGIVYDQKARTMGQPSGILSGHAGIFSTAKDMTNFAKGIINGKILDRYYIEMMAQNRTGRKYYIDKQEKYIQYLGMLCFSKHPILSDSELFHAMSGKSFASSGWTGTQLTIDPVNELYFFMASNRSHNRMTYIDPLHSDKVNISNIGKKTIILPNGKEIIDSTRFAWDRDSAVVHPALKLLFQYKMLEDIYSLINNMELKQVEKVKHL